MKDCPRRTFLKTLALGGAALKLGPFAWDAIAGLGGMQRFVNRGDTVWVKPNIGWNRKPEQAATTNPDVVSTVVALCYQAGAKHVIVSDNSCNPAVTSFARSGIQEAAQKAGADCFVMDDRKFKSTKLNGKVL